MSLRKFALFAALAAALSFSADVAVARPGGGSSVGSRGAKTYSAPPSTRTAPNSASPIQRSITPQAPRSAGAARQTSGFGRGLLGGLLGAGLIGMLLGHGLMGGLGGLMSLIGLIVQVGLIVLLVRFAIGFFRRQQPQTAGAGTAPAAPQGAASYRAAPGAGFAGGAAPPPPLQIDKGDFDAFERRLAEVETAFSAEDVGTLRRICTPEVAAHLEQEIADNSARGLVNKIGGVRLLQGDLAEAWREPDGEYATVAMRFALTDAMVERESGRVVSGSETVPDEVTELWTFRRPPGSDPSAWALSAMQQAA